MKLAGKNIGDEITLSNGAVARVAGGRYMDNAANRRLGRVGQTYKKLVIVQGGNPPTQRRRRTIPKDQAQRAFNKYWKQRMATAEASGNSRRVTAVKGAMKRDIEYGRPAGLRNNTSYKQNPGRLEFEGVDFGPKRYKAPTAAQLRRLAANRDIIANTRRKKVANNRRK